MDKNEAPNVNPFVRSEENFLTMNVLDILFAGNGEKFLEFSILPTLTFVALSYSFHFLEVESSAEHRCALDASSKMLCAVLRCKVLCVECDGAWNWKLTKNLA